MKDRSIDRSIGVLWRSGTLEANEQRRKRGGAGRGIVCWRPNFAPLINYEGKNHLTVLIKCMIEQH